MCLMIGGLFSRPLFRSRHAGLTAVVVGTLRAF
jgi:hypothetical protein